MVFGGLIKRRNQTTPACLYAIIYCCQLTRAYFHVLVGPTMDNNNNNNMVVLVVFGLSFWPNTSMRSK